MFSLIIFEPIGVEMDGKQRVHSFLIGKKIGDFWISEFEICETMLFMSCFFYFFLG